MNNYRIIYPNELNHHGVKGMKWGVRKEPRSMGGRLHRLAAANYNLNARFWGKNNRNKALASMNKQAANQSLKKAAAADARKKSAIKVKKSKVSSYSKSYDKASSLSDKADAKWRQTSQTYKELGRTPLGRINQVRKAQKGGGSAKAKQYLKQYDSWEKSQDAADSAWSETRKKRSEIGKNWITRTVRTVKYSRD